MNRLFKRMSVLLVALTIALPAWALSLQDAKSQGKVGEMPNGYLGAIERSAEVITLVKDVNNRRKAIYQKMAKKNGITVEQVAHRAAIKAFKKTKAGHYIQNEAGEWEKK